MLAVYYGFYPSSSLLCSGRRLLYPESFDLGLLAGSTNERTNEGPEGRKGERSGPLSSSFLGQPCPPVITAWDSSSSTALAIPDLLPLLL